MELEKCPLTGWEYKTRFCFDHGNAEQMEDMNQTGAEGWELVSVIWLSGSQYRFYFKRRLPERGDTLSPMLGEFL